MKKYFIVTINLFILNLLISSQVYSQTSLQKKFEQIADTSKGNIGISALHLESGESISLNGDRQFPMQSVYKFPIAMLMLHEIDKGNFFLSDTISINKNEYIPKAGHSPLRDTYPNGQNLP